MLQKGFLKSQAKKSDRRFISILSKSLLYVGIAILIVALSYVAINFAEAGSIVSICIPIAIAGVCLIFISIFIGRVGRTDTKSGPKSRFLR